jgi:HEXXH motif-containing protein
VEPADLFGFRPDAARARCIDQRARDELASSLGEVFAACRGHLVWDEAAGDELLAGVRRHPVTPGLFGLYADLVEAVFAERLDEAQALIGAIASPRLRHDAGRAVLTLTDEDLGPGQAIRYRRLLNDEPHVAVAVAPVDRAACHRAAVSLAEAESLLAAGAPEIAAEIAELVRQTIIVQSRPTAEFPLVFDGASTFYLWGAVFLNVERLPTRVALAEALVHEVGHCHLFGITLGAPLVENPASERYESPLREDPRPMDGVVHAAYVLARMMYCLDRLIASDVLTPEETDAAMAALHRDRRLFDEGLVIIDRSARFTPTGEAVFNHARRFVEAIEIRTHAA